MSGPLDRSAFRLPLINLPVAPHASELSRLSLYRLGLSGTWAKYRVVPRSAIVAHDQLAEKVHAYDGTSSARVLIEQLWRDHGAPSPRVVDRFIDSADLLDGADRIDGANDPRQRQELLQRWLEECAPRSGAGRFRDTTELAICYLLRRTRQYARVAKLKVTGQR